MLHKAVILGADLAQLMDLAAGLARRAKGLTVVVTDEPLARAAVEPADRDVGLVVCLTGTPPEDLDTVMKERVVFVVPDGTHVPPGLRAYGRSEASVFPETLLRADLAAAGATACSRRRALRPSARKYWRHA
jgi:hypothetical protein